MITRHDEQRLIHLHACFAVIQLSTAPSCHLWILRNGQSTDVIMTAYMCQASICLDTLFCGALKAFIQNVICLISKDTINGTFGWRAL